MIVLRTPKGWTCPPVVDGQQVEGTFRAHQVPLPGGPRPTTSTAAVLEAVAAVLPARGAVRRRRAARCPSCCDARPAGRPADERQPGRQRRRACCATCGCPTGATTRVDGRPRPAPPQHEATRVLGGWLRDVTAANPDELPDLRPRRAGQQPAAGHPRGHRPRLAGRRSASTTSGSTAHGRVIEVLSEHICQGLLEGYLLTGRHGLFTCYEAFIHIVDSMFNQHAKWLEASAAGRRGGGRSPA